MPGSFLGTHRGVTHMSDFETRMHQWAVAERSSRATREVDAALRPFNRSHDGRVCLASLRAHHAAPSTTLDEKLATVRAHGVSVTRQDFQRAFVIGLAVAAQELDR